MPRARFRPTIVTWRDLESPPHHGFQDLHLLAEGDSWFTISGFPAYNLLFELRFRVHTRIVNCGSPGDTIKNIANIARNRDLREALSTPGCHWDAILLSAGGNDVIEEADNALLPRRAWRTTLEPPERYINEAQLQQILARVEAGYRRIVDLRDAGDIASRSVPILIHTYDYSTPRDAPARFLVGSLGPWLYRDLVRREVPEHDWISVANFLIDQLAQLLLGLQRGSNPLPNFHVKDTRGTLEPAELGAIGDTNDWQNEIHPNGAGYEKLAVKLEEELSGLLGTRWFQP